MRDHRCCRACVRSPSRYRGGCCADPLSWSFCIADDLRSAKWLDVETIVGLAIAWLCKGPSGGRSRLMNVAMVDYCGGDVDVVRLFVYACIQ